MHSFDNYRLLFKDVHIPFAVYREWIMVKGDFLIQTLSPTSIELKKNRFCTMPLASIFVGKIQIHSLDKIIAEFVEARHRPIGVWNNVIQ